MRPLRTFIVLVLLIGAFALIAAPAALLRQVLPSEASASLTGLSGTLWNGRADLVLGGRPAGALAWRFRPVTILQGALGYDLTLADGDAADGLALAGTVRLRPGGIETVLDGTVGAGYLNPWIGGYDIELSGTFTLEGVRIDLPWRFERAAEPIPASGASGGRLAWTGGPVRYILSGRPFSGNLPPLEAAFGEGLETVVRAAADGPGGTVPSAVPLLRAELLANGFVRIGMTRLLTRMLNNPWPGSDGDHEVVLEVEEQLL